MGVESGWGASGTMEDQEGRSRREGARGAGGLKEATRLATLQKRNKKLTDENPVNEGLDMYKSTDEFRMIPSVF